MTPQSGFGLPTDWADLTAVAIALFTAAQVGLAWWNEHRRKAEREADQHERERVAYGALWVEYARMWSVALQWQSRDFVGETMLDLFDPSDILPRDWGAATLHLSELGHTAAHLGGVAYTFAAQAEASGRAILGAIDLIRRRYPNIPEGLHEAERTMTSTFIMARSRQHYARWYAKEAELMFLDAIENSRPGRAPNAFTPLVTAKSQYGKQLQLQIRHGVGAKQLEAPVGPPPMEREST